MTDVGSRYVLIGGPLNGQYRFLGASCHIYGYVSQISKEVADACYPFGRQCEKHPIYVRYRLSREWFGDHPSTFHECLYWHWTGCECDEKLRYAIADARRFFEQN